MKLAVVGPVFPYRGGIAHFTTQMVQKLVETGNVVQVYSYKRQYPAFLYPGKSDHDDSKQAIKLDADYLLDPLNPLTWAKTSREIVQYAPEAVVIQWWVTFWSPAYAYLARRLRREGLTVIYLVHNVMPHEPKFYDTILARMALSKGSGFIALSSREEDRLRRLLPTSRIQMCPHPVYDLFRDGSISKEQARRELNLPLDIPVLLFFGIVRPYKGLAYLIDAVGLLRDQGKKVHLVVAGEFWEHVEKYQQQINDQGLQDQARLDNRYIPNEEVGRYFSAADLLVAPYVDGTQSGAIKIAMGCGLPVLATQPIATDLPEDIPSVPAGDAAALAGGIEKALGSPRVQTAYGMDNSWAILAEKIETFI
jgi:glycosyltransferase involved in cell wall biosynthesis